MVRIRESTGAKRMLSLWSEHSFRLHIAVLFSALVFFVGAALSWGNYIQGRDILLTVSADAFARIERETRSEMKELRGPVEAVVDWVSHAPIIDATTYEARMRALPAMVEVLNRYAMLESVYVGYSTGDFFQVHALRDATDRQRFGAPQHAAFRLQSIERSARMTRFKLLDADLNEAENLPVKPDYSFDPRVRPWYIEALRHTGLVQTAPYVFFTTQHVGQTIARRAEHGRAVVGADMTLSRISEMLLVTRPSPSSVLAVFDTEHGVLADSGGAHAPKLDDQGNPLLPRLDQVSPALAMLAPAVTAATGVEPHGKARSVRVDGREWLVRIVPADDSAQGVTYLGVATPSDELLVSAREALWRNLWLGLVLVLLTAPFTWWVARRIAGNLNALTEQAAALRSFNFDKPAAIHSRVVEINDLGHAMGQMRETIRKFVDITTALSGERKFYRLLRRVLVEAREAAGGEGCVIYLLDEEGGTLRPEDQVWDGGHAASGASVGNLPDISLQDEMHPVARAARGAAAPDTHLLVSGRGAGMAFLESRFGDGPVMLVTVPLLDRSGGTVGVLCIFQRGEAAAPSPERLALVEAFAGAGAVAIHNQRLLAEQKALLKALIELLARAIDAKSHYTAGHCLRVPELTYMLTQVACDETQGPFANFNLDEEGWEALHIAGGLHDCGKVTTPEYVVDKATKLETICDRIHEVRTRFEVLKRDAEIACLKAIAAGGDARALRAELARELQAIDEDFAFVAACNEGGEYMAPEKIERLQQIAARTWQRTLDDRLGISWEEAERKQRTPAMPLPATEHLLADRPEHIIPRHPGDIMDENNPWGFRHKMPEALYNRGELYNLSIQRGTLNEEERYKINDHIMQTIVMLSALPFPRHLKSVPELAGGHHEKMDGTGYPKRLGRTQMSVPARIMAIADIFEALTAADRPYKKAKKLSEAIKIMSFMKKDRHIDPDLFDLFLKSGVYRRYAEKFMPPEYIDEVDVSAYVREAA